MENSIAAGKSRISNQTKFRQFVRRIFGGNFCEKFCTSNDLTRSGPCCESRKSESAECRKQYWGMKSSCRGGKKIALPYCQRTLELQMNGSA
ncbi:hypothetical protein AVEN_47234-1 [Araneus ventricosus]|uniref:Uncharacterized protein n=1 Tax=Araneus ventricosus TaxID=182803 RepID=A0A4Y2HGC1_ARAVE|nr:hypothetical protein AVEN_47234-1 [Araneus ventricosus]